MDSDIGGQQLEGLRSSFDAFDHAGHGHLSHAQAAAMLRSMLSHGHRDEYEVLRKEQQVVVLRKVPPPPRVTERKEIAVASWGVVVEDGRERSLEQPSATLAVDTTTTNDSDDQDEEEEVPDATAAADGTTDGSTSGGSGDGNTSGGSGDGNTSDGSGDGNTSGGSGDGNASGGSAGSNRSNRSDSSTELATVPEPEPQLDRKLEHRVWYSQFVCMASPLLGGPIAPERLLVMASPHAAKKLADDDEASNAEPVLTRRPAATFAVAVGACGGMAMWRLTAASPFAAAISIQNVDGKQVLVPSVVDSCLQALSAYSVFVMSQCLDVVVCVRCQALASLEYLWQHLVMLRSTHLLEASPWRVDGARYLTRHLHGQILAALDGLG